VLGSNVLFLAGSGLIAAAFGFAADSLARRWPDHEPDYEPRPRVDWRTIVAVAASAAAFVGLGLRWADNPTAYLVLAPFFMALVVLLATDLDQKLLPDVVTLPLIAFAVVVLVANLSPILHGKDLGLVSGIAAALVLPAFLWVMDRVIGGDLGFGDLKLAVSVGLMFGLSALFTGLIVASVGFSVVLVALIAVRRIGLKTAVPFGPVLIFAAFVAALWA
jgi:leader peptidase (prepilin peptidase)/N-methyltransferase